MHENIYTESDIQNHSNIHIFKAYESYYVPNKHYDIVNNICKHKTFLLREVHVTKATKDKMLSQSVSSMYFLI